jgi:tetratricopeptide (TPR) repeat protein
MKMKSMLFAMVFALGFGTLAGQETETAASLYNQGLELLKAKDYAGAFPILEKALAVADPEADAEVVKLANRNGSIAAYYLGNDLRGGDKFAEALQVYDKGIAMDPSRYANFIGRAQAIEGMGDDLAAIDAYIEAGLQSEKAGKADRAPQLYSKAENMVAKAYSGKNWNNTISFAQAFLAKRETADVYYYLSQAQLEKGSKDEALANADKSLELATEDKNKFYFGKAEILKSMGQKTGAIEAYKMVTGGPYAERAKYEADQLAKG